MIQVIVRYLAICLVFMTSVPVLGLAEDRKNETIVLGSELPPKDTLKQRRFTNHLIAPKGEWQCGLSVMYADFDSSDSDYMLVIQGLNARASMLRMAPEALYTFRDNHAVGVRFNYTKINGMLDSATADMLGNLNLSLNDVNAVSTSMGGCLFQRTYIGIDTKGRFGIFWDYMLGYTRSKTQFAAGGASSSYSEKEKVNLAFAPGVIYFPMNNISVQANISLADLSYSCTTANEGGKPVGTHRSWGVKAGLNLLNLSFGLTIHL